MKKECHPYGTRPCHGHGMKCAVATRPKALTPKLAPQIPVDDAEALALYLVEHVPPAMRRELGRLLTASAS